MKNNEPIAHISEDGRVHSLREHLEGTAKLAAEFAGEFGCGEWGRLAGLWHDLGKYSPAFQKKIHAAADSGKEAHIEAKARVDHSTAGALNAEKQMGLAGRILAYIAAGHHAGLADWQADQTGRAALSQRLQTKSLLDDALQGEIPNDILDQQIPNEKPQKGTDPAFWIRMLFSCLVDADFLDTEFFFDPDKSIQRSRYPQIKELQPLFERYMALKQSESSDTPVNRQRAVILQQCNERAVSEPGIFTLTVPTGGGKTLSSMAFALNHAMRHDKRRIIYVIPYTSIIEQTADQFRQIFSNAVIEHHSNIDVSDETKETPRSRLACENWDAPVIVTTSVQFFESLFSSRTSRSRKLHNIVNSVVILDEVQMLPPEYLKPILSTLMELQKNYGVTLVLSTATQPALGKREGFDGLDGVTEIIDNPSQLHNAFKRVSIHVPADLNRQMSWDELASELNQHDSVLCIVSRRDDARKLWSLMPKSAIHLSALMCGAHRSAKIGHIKEGLKLKRAVKVVSTQLVEAGVDLDFPVVYRALAGLDSIAQAAGRCNREGLLEKGQVIVFVPQSDAPPGLLRQTADIGRRLLAGEHADPLNPERFDLFFKELYWLQGDRLDRHGILLDLAPDNELRFSYRTAASKFHIIDEKAQASVIVRYGEGSALVSQLERIGPERWLMRRLQRYVVNLPRYLHKKLLACGAICEVYPDVYIQGHTAMYDDDLGFCPDKSMIYDPDELIS
ncbi:MAG: CRISPR-associated helicase Cas3' [Nitrospirae bacterium]|nr:CRISPR-associated helicase Cas3' [Nitrospirota bacterium]